MTQKYAVQISTALPEQLLIWNGEVRLKNYHMNSKQKRAEEKRCLAVEVSYQHHNDILNENILKLRENVQFEKVTNVCLRSENIENNWVDLFLS
ncbi:hypothetical protein L596_006556 [Steinernema carpocapsae]|uniref:Uncharacterized protein n=1 Tax=Steinernema carpocapsae TaxID=34508 RepID=A0A4U8V9N4_STECR|nr:hypothetical protein L596_006556 [Steinernema carpocapsae]